MNATTYTVIEVLLFDYCCGLHSARYVQRVLRGLGYHADLRGNSYIIDVFNNATGVCYPVAT